MAPNVQLATPANGTTSIKDHLLVYVQYLDFLSKQSLSKHFGRRKNASFQMITTLFVIAATMLGTSNAQLSTKFYAKTCPNVSDIVERVLMHARDNDIWTFPRIVRLHFHDCFVHGCDASLLLNGTDGEKTVDENLSLDGFAVNDDIKTTVEKVCPRVVSCADILALAARFSVTLGGGPSWKVPLGRRDSRTAHREGIGAIPTGHESLANIAALFKKFGFDTTDLVALSGVHTFGRARCAAFMDRLYNFNNVSGKTDPTLNATYAKTLKQRCPKGGDVTDLVDLDKQTALFFEHNYFLNLQNNMGLLQSDQTLFSTKGTETVALINRFASSQSQFYASFAKAIITMGNISPLTGTNGEVKLDCKMIN